MKLTHFSLFSGIGGFDLAAEWAGFRTVGQVEKNPYRQKVLRKYWPDVPLWEDIRDVTEETLANIQDREQSKLPKGNSPPDSQERPEFRAGNRGRGGSTTPRIDVDRRATTAVQRPGSIPPVTLVTGGFPCQPFSAAGKRRGKADDRYLWPEMFRVIKLLRPHWVLAENVAGITGMVQFDSDLEVDDKEYSEEEMAESLLNMGEVRERTGQGILWEILEDLKSEGYEVQPFLIPACSTGAPHQRYRVWIVAFSNGNEYRGRRRPEGEEESLQGVNREARCSRGISRAGETSKIMAYAEQGKVGNGGAPGRTPDEGGGATEAGGEAIRPGEKAPQPGDTGQGGEAISHPEGREDDRREGGNLEKAARRGQSGNSSFSIGSKDVSHSTSNRCDEKQDEAGVPKQEIRQAPTREPSGAGGSQRDGAIQWESEPDVGRVADGVPHRVDRLAALGDAIVPQVAYQILKAIAEIERAVWTE
ncbi:hypothetical protein ES708_19265 [subsurface metagenome]